MVEIKNIDIMKINEIPKYDIVYTDPPWEQGMVNFFENKLLNKPGNSIDDLLKKVASLCKTNKPIFIEYSVKGKDRVIQHFISAGHKYTGTLNQIQSNGKPYVLICFNFYQNLEQDIKGFNIIKRVIEATQAITIIDFFAGIGQTAKAVLKCNCDYIGFEINPERFNKLQKVINNERLKSV